MSSDDDSRRHPRRELTATAHIFSPEQLHGTFLVQDLSASGACLVGHLAPPPEARLTLLLQVPGKAPFSVAAQVVRHDARGLLRSRTAVTFLALTPEQERIIQETIAAGLERERARLSATVLVLAPEGDSREELEEDLRALGHEALAVSTPLEALAWLERPGTRIGTAVVDLSPSGGSGLDMLDFLGEHHPGIQRVVIADDSRLLRLDLALRSGRAHRVLRKPWDRHHLAEVIGSAGRPPRRPSD
jgi:CheY-like chemotaxis protein